MAITGAPQILVGGAVSNGPALGDYHIIVSDAQLGESKTSGRGQLVLELTVKDDPNNPSKEGKKLTKMFQSLPAEGDDPEKVKQMQGMLKRLVYDGFGVKWPAEPKPIDPRIFVGKPAWIRLDNRKNNQTGEERSQVVAVAQAQDKLPVRRGETGNVAKPAGRGGASARR